MSMDIVDINKLESPTANAGLKKFITFAKELNI